MKPGIAFAAALTLLLGSLAAAARPVDLGEDPARAIAGKELPANDARVEQARSWLKQIAAATGESEEQVAASAMKLSRFIFDSLKMRALPLEALEGMATQAAPGRPLSDLTAGYFNARRNTADKSHAAAMAALAGRK
jgi:hypothetical protein